VSCRLAATYEKDGIKGKKFVTFQKFYEFQKQKFKDLLQIFYSIGITRKKE
jgi:hypothetical protein